MADDPAQPDSDDGIEHLSITVRKLLPGRRLDKYLTQRISRLSRTTIQRLIKRGEITVNGRPTKASYEPEPGDVIDMTLPPPEPTEIEGEDIPLDIVFEDEHIMAINKQAGIICHPAKASQHGTIANAAVYHCEHVSKCGDAARPGIVHRLDKNTTGIMLLAKRDEALWRLCQQFENRTIKKTYLAVVQGELQLDRDIIDAPLAAHAIIKDRFMVPGFHHPPMIKKEAITYYEALERFDGYTLVSLSPKTGRTHQLRVHMSFLGHPIVGDVSYGGRTLSECDLAGEGSENSLIEYQALHAWRIEFVHPILEKTMSLEAPLSDRIQCILDLLRTHRGRS